MSFKPPYWYHDNIEFSYEDLKELKFDILIFLNRHLKILCCRDTSKVV